MPMENIFVAQALKSLDNDSATRTYGWFSTMDLAKESLLANADFVAEATIAGPYYPYALIEEVPEGICSIGIMMDIPVCKFYQYKDGTYVEIPRPKKWDGIVGFTMG